MPFSDLDPAAQKFVKKYFKSGGLFRKNRTSQEDRDRMADEYSAWLREKARVEQRIADMAGIVPGTDTLTADLTRISDLVDNDKKSLNATRATALLEPLELKITDVGKRWYDRVKAEAKTAVDTMKTYHGVARDIPRYENRLNLMDPDFNATPPNWREIVAARLFIVNGRQDLKTISDAYQSDYQESRDHIQSNCEDRLGEITDPVVAAERAEIEQRIAFALQKLEEHADWLAYRLATSIGYDIDAAKKIIDEKNAYQPIKAAATTEFGKLRAALNPGADDDFPLIEADIARADGLETARDFYGATLIMKQIPDRVAPLLVACAAYTDFEGALDAANKALEHLKAHHLAEYVPADILVIETEIRAAVNEAAVSNYGQAKTMLDPIPAQSKNAEKEAEKAGPFATLLQDAASGDVDDLIDAAKARYSELQSHPRASEVNDAISDIHNFIIHAETAHSSDHESTARAQLVQAAELEALTWKLAEIIHQVYSGIETLEAALATFRSGHAQAAYVATQTGDIDTVIAQARKSALAGDDAAFAQVADGEAKLLDARQLADAEEAFQTRLATVEAAATLLGTTDYPDKTTTQPIITGHLTKAREHSANHDHTKAEGSLKAAESLMATARIAKTADGNGDLNPDDIKALMAEPDGQKKLDEMVRSLTNPSQKVMMALMEARFNMDVKMFSAEGDWSDEGTSDKGGATLNVPGPNLQSYYAMLSGVPETHTKLNPSLARFDRIEDDSGSFYSTDSGAVVMACYTTFTAAMNPLGEPSQLDTIDPECTSMPDSADRPDPTYGTWTTLHEIGHAVDDRQRFMDSREGQSEFGGWRTHGANTAQISGEIAAHFDFDSHYVERKMAGGSPDLPDPPSGVAPAEWETRRDDFETWLTAVRSDQELWESASQTAARKIGDRVIHEAYEGVWVSYDFAARRKGVTGYQFRAPGEWFSELYAAFHTQKMNPSHPATKWLAAL